MTTDPTSGQCRDDELSDILGARFYRLWFERFPEEDPPSVGEQLAFVERETLASVGIAELEACLGRCFQEIDELNKRVKHQKFFAEFILRLMEDVERRPNKNADSPARPGFQSSSAAAALIIAPTSLATGVAENSPTKDVDSKINHASSNRSRILLDNLKRNLTGSGSYSLDAIVSRNGSPEQKYQR